MFELLSELHDMKEGLSKERDSEGKFIRFLDYYYAVQRVVEKETYWKASVH